MNTQLSIKSQQLQNWALIIKDCKESGLKVIDYCEQHSITKYAYYYWFKKVKESIYSSTDFVEITPPVPVPTLEQSMQTSPAPADGFIEIKASGLTFSVPLSVSKETLSMIAEVAAHAE